MNKKVRIVSIIVIIILCIAFSRMSLDDSNDTFYLIKLGESISKNGIDMIDHFSWIPNLTYTYPHWLYSVILYFIYHMFSFTGIYIFSTCCYIIFGLIIYYVNLKMNKDNVLALIASIMCIFPLGLFMNARSQSISIILLFLEIFFISQLINTGKKKYIAYLCICSLIIANVHATIWPVFFIFFLPFFGEHIVYLYSKRKKKELSFNDRISVDKINNIKYLLIAFVICFLMGILTPSRICYTYYFKIMMGDSQSYIVEHFPLVIIKFPLVMILLFLLFFTKSKIKLSEFFMICGITLMTFIAQRHFIFFCTIGILYFSIILKRNIDDNKDYTLKILEKKLLNNNLFIVILLFVVSLVCYFKLNSNIKEGFISKNIYPEAAVNYIKDNLDYKNVKIINDYDFGSYLLFNDIKVFADSRCDLYFKEFNGLNMDILDDYSGIMYLYKDYDYDTYLKKYDANYFLLKIESELYHVLEHDERYKLVYYDDYFGLYERIYDKKGNI